MRLLASFIVAFSVLASVFAGSSDYYYQNWCNVSSLPFQYLYDQNCAKVFPSSFDREWRCPVLTLDDTSANVAMLAAAGYAPDQSMSIVAVDTATLDKIVTNGASLCVVMTKRVRSGSSEGNVKLYNKYYCAGTHSATNVYETWSSSKIFAMANAGGHLRADEISCNANVFGLDSSPTGKHGSTQFGDLATVVCSYDHTAGYSSNSLSSFFHDMVSLLLAQ